MNVTPNFKWKTSQDFDHGIVCVIDNSFSLYANGDGSWAVYNQDTIVADGVCKGGGLEPAKTSAIDAFCGYLLGVLEALKLQFRPNYFNK